MRRSLASLALLVSASACAAAPLDVATPAVRATWTTLGTNSGPLTLAGRWQPANLLRADGEVLLVDCGDGASELLQRAGVSLGAVRAVFLSHLHFDHTGGLFAFLGRRFQTRNPGVLTIYGPPGTRRTVDGLLAAMQPMADKVDTFAFLAKQQPGDNIRVVELVDGATVAVGAIRITAAVNSHYVLADENGEGNHSLSFRFDTSGRSIVYTGDTGPSASVEALAKDVDLLVAEVMDPAESIERIGRARSDLNALLRFALKRHFSKQHLSPEEAGRMAQRSGAKALLLTHNALAPESLEPARARIAAQYPGPITFAEDSKSY
jgi:ribonuclease BN (tRNA processing enzyme)